MAHQIPAANHPGRNLRAATPYHSRFVDRRKKFLLSQKPDLLRHLDSLPRKFWKQYETHQKRLSPLEEAELYARQMEARRLKSRAALARLLGKQVNRISRVLKLVDLPEPVKEFLRGHRDPVYLRYFTEPKLTELLKLQDGRAAWRRFQEMVAEAEREAGIWRSPTG